MRQLRYGVVLAAVMACVVIPTAGDASDVARRVTGGLGEHGRIGLGPSDRLACRGVSTGTVGVSMSHRPGRSSLS